MWTYTDAYSHVLDDAFKHDETCDAVVDASVDSQVCAYAHMEYKYSFIWQMMGGGWLRREIIISSIKWTRGYI